MDKLRQKSKKDKPQKSVEKEKSPLFITDVKTIKENLKIKEILRTVKMNSSMRIKAPRGSRVMHNKDFNDLEDGFEEVTLNEGECTTEHPTATNLNVVVDSSIDATSELANEKEGSIVESSAMESVTKDSNVNERTALEPITIHKSTSFSGCSSSIIHTEEENVSRTPYIEITPTSECPPSKPRDRKLSLDHTMLSRREGLSQSELDLHSIGKSPLERKSSFFRKRMDSFLRNTTEIFKRQSQSKSPSVHRRDSMSASLQSLNENTSRDGNYIETTLRNNPEMQSSATSLQSCSTTTGRSNSSLSVSQGERLDEEAGEENRLMSSQPALTKSQPLGELSSNSVHSLNEAYMQDSLLNSRAISMSSGLDTAHGKGRRKSSRSNRVSWLASEGLTNYFRRQEEKNKEMQVSYSYQDFSTIPENNMYGSKLDSKGRRLSYQRAVSGEDPVPSSRYQDTLRRKALIPENSVAKPDTLHELTAKLDEYTRTGVPDLKHFNVFNVRDDSIKIIEIIVSDTNYLDSFNKNPSKNDLLQSVLKEFISTEARYIHQLIFIVSVFISTAHDLQKNGLLMDFNTERLFSNIPDLLNANLYFWEVTISRMLSDVMQNGGPFNAELMKDGFSKFKDIFQPYERYIKHQKVVMNYLKTLTDDMEFNLYITWCFDRTPFNRLKLSDLLAKPVQRLTKYSLLLNRMLENTEGKQVQILLTTMERNVKSYVVELNRNIRCKEEVERIKELANIIEPLDVDFRDEEADRIFRKQSHLGLLDPMMDCLHYQCRSIVYEGDIKFRDSIKELDAHVIIFEDFILICKKLSKGHPYTYRQVRPKYRTLNIRLHTKYKTRDQNKEIFGLICLVTDHMGSSETIFMLSDPKDPSSIRTWEAKIREAQFAYKYGIQLAFKELPLCRNRSPSTYSGASVSKHQHSEEIAAEREGEERAIVMTMNKMSVASDFDVSHTTMTSDSIDTLGSVSMPRSLKLLDAMFRTSSGTPATTSSHSKQSSLQKSLSGTSHDSLSDHLDSQHSGTVEQILLPPNEPDGVGITVTLASDNELEVPLMIISQPSPPASVQLSTASSPVWPVMPTVVLQQASPSTSPSSHSVSTSRNTLHVQEEHEATVHSLPELSNINSTVEHLDIPSPTMSAAEKLYMSHQELLERNRIAAFERQQFLRPDRVTSSAPRSPTRNPLQRGFAFCYSYYHPTVVEQEPVPASQSQQLANEKPSSVKMDEIEIMPTTASTAAKNKVNQTASNWNDGDMTS